MAGDRLDHFVITSSQIKLDRRIFPEPVRFVLARLLVLHLLFDGTHFLRNDPIAHWSPLSVGHNSAVRSCEPVEMGFQADGKWDPQRLVGFALREVESFVRKVRPLQVELDPTKRDTRSHLRSTSELCGPDVRRVRLCVPAY